MSKEIKVEAVGWGIVGGWFGWLIIFAFDENKISSHKRSELVFETCVVVAYSELIYARCLPIHQPAAESIIIIPWWRGQTIW